MSLISITDLKPEEVSHIIALSTKYSNMAYTKIIKGQSVLMAFFEDSTRTKLSFETAAKKLGAFVSYFDCEKSSLNKGESIKDTVLTLNAFEPSCLVVRSSSSGFCHLLKQYASFPIINAGDGCNEHPTQAIADLSLIKTLTGRVDNLKIAMCGDIMHSRVARSNIKLLKMMGNEVCLVGPPTLSMQHIKDCRISHSIKEGLKGADVVIAIRPQHERMKKLISSTQEYKHLCQLNQHNLSCVKAQTIIMHPGPINRDIEISDSIADIHQKTFSMQIKQGIIIRQAILEYLLCTLKQRN